MTAVNRTVPGVGDAYIWRYNGTTNTGNGKGRYMTVGSVNGDENRSLIAIDISNKAGIATLLHAWLRLTVAPQVCAPRGANVCFWIEELASSFAQGTFGNGNDCSGDPGNAAIWPGPSGLLANRVKYNPGSNPSTDDQLKIDLAPMVRAAWAADKTTLYLRLIAADTTTSAYDGSNPARTATFYTLEAGSGKRPHMDFEGDDAFIPLPPASVTPATTDPGGPAEKPTQVPTTFSVGWQYVTGGQTGDYAKASEFRLYTATATDNDQGAILTGSEQAAGVTGTGVQGGYAVGTVAGTTGPIRITDASLVGKELLGRLRLQSKAGKWSPWTRLKPTTVNGSLVDPGMRLVPNSPPSAPTNLNVDATSTSPDYSGTHVDVDPGSEVSEVQTQVWKQTPAGLEVLENNTSYHPESPDRDQPTAGAGGIPSTFTGTGGQAVAGGTAWTVSHTGRQLVAGERISRRHRTVDQYGGVGAFSAVQTWTVGVAQGPTIIPPPDVKQDSLTPPVGASYAQPFTGIEIESYGDATTPTPLWQPGQLTVAATTSYTLPYGSVGTTPALVPGQKPWLTARVLVGGFWTPWSARSPMTENSLPRAPGISVDDAVLHPSGGGYYTVATRTPRIRFVFSDPDLPGDQPTALVARIWAHPRGVAPLSTVTVIADPFDIYDVPPGLIGWETFVEIDAQHADTSGVFGTVAAPFLLKVSQRPVVTAATPPDPADPTPDITWVASSPSGKPIIRADVVVLGPET